MKTKLGEKMANYRVVTGPAVTTGGMCCGPDDSLSGAPFEQIINQQAQEGYHFVQVFSHQITGACCYIIPKNIQVNLLVFKKD
jgi:hypothetical protein